MAGPGDGCLAHYEAAALVGSEAEARLMLLLLVRNVRRWRDGGEWLPCPGELREWVLASVD